MRRILAFIAFAFAAAICFGVDEQSTFKVGPIGDVVYGSGASVSDEECYVVIFTADGYSFAGFTKDGHLVAPNRSAVVMYGPMSEVREGVECGMGTKADVKSEYLDPLNCTDGVFELYLLDTRIAGGFAPIDEEGDDPTWLPTTINAWALATGSNAIKYSALKFDRSTGVNSGAIVTTQKTVIGSATPVPVIVSFSRTDGAVSVGATNTVPAATYVLKKATDVAFANVIWTSSTQTGSSSPETPLLFSDDKAVDSAAFYRIEVVK